MQVNTSRFGIQEVEESKIIVIPDGMLGFPAEKRYILLTPPKLGPFLWLQSVDNPNLAFVVVDAKEQLPDYSFSLNMEEYTFLGFGEQAEVIYLLVVTMAPDPYDITVNLQGPIVLNPERMLAKQIVLDSGSYTTRHPFFDQAARK